MAWWDATTFSKRLTIYATAVTAAIAAIIAVANAMSTGEPYWIATRDFVRFQIATTSDKIETTQQQLRRRQIQTEIQIVTGRIENIKSKIADRQLLIEKPEGAPPEYRRLIAQQIDEFRDQQKQLEEELAGLRREWVERRT